MSEQPPVDGSYWQRPQGWQPPDEAPATPRRRVGRSVWVLAVVAVLVVAAVAAWRLWPSQEDDVQLAAEQFVAAAADGNCDRAAQLAAGQAADQLGTYCDQQSGSVVAGLFGNQQPVVEVTGVDGESATASVSASIIGVSVSVEMSLVREDGQWKVSGLRLPNGIPPGLVGG